MFCSDGSEISELRTRIEEARRELRLNDKMPKRKRAELEASVEAMRKRIARIEFLTLTWH